MLLKVAVVDVKRDGEKLVGVACVVHCQLSVVVECGDVAGDLVVCELKIHPVPCDVERESEQGVGSEIGGESWWVWVVRGWLRCPGERLLKLLPPAQTLPIVQEVELHGCGNLCFEPL